MPVFDTLDGVRDAADEVFEALAVGRAMGCGCLPQRAMPRFVVRLFFPVAEVLFVEVLFAENSLASRAFLLCLA